MSAAVNMDPSLLRRVESRLGVAPGEAEVIEFSERDNRFRARYRKRDGSLWGMTGVWVVPPEWRGKMTSRAARQSAPPDTWGPGEALHRLHPRLVERVEVSYRQEPGSIGRGELRIRDFHHVRDNVYRVAVYIPSTNFLGACTGTLLQPTRRLGVGVAQPLAADDFAAVVRVFSQLLKRDREREASHEQEPSEPSASVDGGQQPGHRHHPGQH